METGQLRNSLELECVLLLSVSVNCDINQEVSLCSQYGAESCEMFTNVPQECPIMCKWCPCKNFLTSFIITPKEIVRKLFLYLCAVTLT